MPRVATPIDLAVVGAGAAGLAAARAARDRGLRVVLLEAMDRIGGRAHTDHATFGVAWDRGCHWLHSATINPMTAFADEYGFRYQRAPPPWRLHLGDRWATPAEQAAHETLTDAAYADLMAAGRAGRDEAVAAVVSPEALASPRFRVAIHAEWGVPPEYASTLDAVNYRDTGENWPLEDGYGALVARLAAAVPVELSTPVTAIAWAGPRVRVETPDGALDAAAAILTVSTNVLAEGTIRFEPPLPDWKRDAAAALPLGTANKVAFAIPGDRLGVDGLTNLIAPLPGGDPISLRLRPFGRDMVEAYVAGPQGLALEQAGAAELIAAVRDTIAAALGTAVADHLGTAACSRWGAEPSILGAYAAARPGHAHRRPDLARPLENRLFFAGEATSPDFFSTCHGAHLSGIAAAETAFAAVQPDLAPA